MPVSMNMSSELIKARRGKERERTPSASYPLKFDLTVFTKSNIYRAVNDLPQQRKIRVRSNAPYSRDPCWQLCSCPFPVRVQSRHDACNEGRYW